jgi:hypothetical protein
MGGQEDGLTGGQAVQAASRPDRLVAPACRLG